MKEKQAKEWYYRPAIDVAMVLGVTQGRVSQLVKEGILPPPEGKFYNLVECNRAFQKFREGDSRGTFLNERARLTQHQADMKELEVEEKRRELIPAKEAERLWGGVVIAVKQKILALPSKVAPKILDGMSLPEKNEVIQEGIYDVLHELSNPGLSKGADLERDTERDGDIPAAAEIDRKPVGGRKKKVKPGVECGAGEVAHIQGGVPEGDDGCVERSDDRVCNDNDISAGGKDGDPE